MKRTVQTAGSTLGVERVRDCERVWIQFDDGMQGGAVAIERLNARDVRADDLPCRSAAGLLVLNERANRRFFEIEGARRLLESMNGHR